MPRPTTQLVAGEKMAAIHVYRGAIATVTGALAIRFVSFGMKEQLNQAISRCETESEALALYTAGEQAVAAERYATAGQLFTTGLQIRASADWVRQRSQPPCCPHCHRFVASSPF